jgi:hypothetical protein
MPLISTGHALRTIGATGAVTVAESSFPTQWARQKEEYTQLRGFDVGRNTKPIPRTTLADAEDLLQYWGRQGGNSTHLDAKWWRTFETSVRLGIIVAEVLPGNNESILFPDNQALWDGLQRRATNLASTTAIPTRWEMATEAISEAIDDVRERAGDVAKFLWPDWLTTALKVGGVGIGVALGIHWFAGRKK